MAKRRLSRRQKNRIQSTQSALSASQQNESGVVISHQGGQLLAELESGSTVECKIKSNLGIIVCGDRITIEPTTPLPRVIAVLPRDNLLQRIDGLGQRRAIAANISQLFVCLAIAPEPNLFLLDQYLLSAEQQQINTVIVLNKIDLDPQQPDPFELRQIYAPLGYKIVTTSVKTGAGMEAFNSLLTGQVSVLSGVSGVGKSSLTSWLLPEMTIKISRVSHANAAGRHTTRTSRLYHLPNGGNLIDTPGVRGFNPFVDSTQPLAHGFREILDFSANCRYHNCLHRNEPKCAVTTAVDAGFIARSRYRHYLKMLDQTE